jgi:hypothetical protein
VRLLCTIYAKGYYARWTEPLRYKLTAVLPGMSEEQITEIVRQLAEWGFFSKELFEQEGVLTSEDIQRRYFEAVKRRNYPSDMQYLLLEDVGADAAERGAKEKRAAAGKSARKNARKSEGQQVVNQPVNQFANQPVNPVNNDAVVVDDAAVDDELDEIEARADAAAEEMRRAQARAEAEAALRAAAEAAEKAEAVKAQTQVQPQVQAQVQGGESAGGSLSLVRGIPMMKRDTAWMRSAAQFVCKPSAEVCKLIDEFANNCRCQKIEQHKDLDDLERHFISWLKKCKGYNEAGGQGQVYGPQSPGYGQAYGQGGRAYGQGRGQAPSRAEDTIDERTRRMGYLLDRPERIHKDWSGGF